MLLYSGLTTTQVLEICTPSMLIDPYGRELTTGIQIFPTNLTSEQILAQCVKIEPITSSGSTLY